MGPAPPGALSHLLLVDQPECEDFVGLVQSSVERVKSAHRDFEAARAKQALEDGFQQGGADAEDTVWAVARPAQTVSSTACATRESSSRKVFMGSGLATASPHLGDCGTSGFDLLPD